MILRCVVNYPVELSSFSFFESSSRNESSEGKVFSIRIFIPNFQLSKKALFNGRRESEGGTRRTDLFTKVATSSLSSDDSLMNFVIRRFRIN